MAYGKAEPIIFCVDFKNDQNELTNPFSVQNISDLKRTSQIE